MLNVRRIADLYQASVGRRFQEIEQINADTIQIETDIAGSGDCRGGYVTLFVARGDEGWFVADDDQFVRTARRCRLEPQLPPGVSQHGETLVVQTRPGAQELGRGLRLMYSILKPVHELDEENWAAEVFALDVSSRPKAEPRATRAVLPA